MPEPRAAESRRGFWTVLGRVKPLGLALRVCEVKADGLTVETASPLVVNAAYEFGLTVDAQPLLIWGRVVRSRELRTGGRPRFLSEVVFIE